MRSGVRLGIDVGSVRTGVARSDPAGVLASPVQTVRASGGGTDASTLDRVAALAAEHEAVEVVVGMPRSLSGGEGPSARVAREFATALAGRVHPLPVRLVDERFSTVAAERTLQTRGWGGRARRRVVDQQAAVAILQAALDAERASGRAPGEVVRGRE